MTTLHFDTSGKPTSHKKCDHPSTPAARAKCRKQRAEQAVLQVAESKKTRRPPSREGRPVGAASHVNPWE